MATRALVLGGGGVTGVAWELGILRGLAEAGVDLRVADLVVGTSAGSMVGAQISSGASVEDRYAAQLAGPVTDAAPRMGSAAMVRFCWALLLSGDPQRTRARIGRLALSTKTVPEAERRAVIEARLGVSAWPRQRLLITAVDAESGEFVAFDRDWGVSLIDAVSASCAVPGVWPAVTIDGRRWIDGGVRSPANADLAAECDRVVIVAPMAGGFRSVPSVHRQVARLRAEGREVAVVSPDEAAQRAIGRKVLDPARRAPAARAGYEQSASVAEDVAAVWSVQPEIPARGQ